jgi:hypothetical protein
MDQVPAAGRATIAVPERMARAIDAVIVCDFIAFADLAQGNYGAPAIDRPHICVRIAAMVDMAFGGLHEDGPLRFQIVTMARIVAGFKGMGFVDDPRVVDHKYFFTGVQWLFSKYAEAVYRRRFHFHEGWHARSPRLHWQAPATDEVDDLQVIALVKFRIAPAVSRHNVTIQFHGHAIGFHA